MNKLINNVYTVFANILEDYNLQRSEKIELAYIGTCQDFHVFAGDWQNLFLINDEGGFEIYLKNKTPKTINDISAAVNYAFYTTRIKDFNFKIFIKWLNKRNLLVNRINWTNLEVIDFIQKSSSKIQPFDEDILISEKTGKHYGVCIGCSQITYHAETYFQDDKPHVIIRDNEGLNFKLYLSDKKPKTQKELEIVPISIIPQETLAEKIKDLKYWIIQDISIKSKKCTFYYELLLLYRAFNPSLNVDIIKNPPDNFYNRKYGGKKQLTYITSIEYIVKNYAKNMKLNPYKILAKMYEQDLIDNNAKINESKRKELIQEYSYLLVTKTE